MKIYRFICLILILAMLPLSAFTTSAAQEPSITGWSGICIDYDTGEVLYAKDVDSMRCPASMTKIMTAYIIYEELEKGNLTKDSLFFISDNARKISYNGNYPKAVPLNDKYISVDQALKNILIPSASATCIVAAENISGSEEAFVERMNETAKRLGMKAEYKNSHGAIAHYLTCRSVAILVREFINTYPDVLNYTSMTSMTYNGVTWTNTNGLLSNYKYEGCDGFKTGTISAAGCCLASTAVRDGRRIIAIVMGAPDSYNRHTDSIKVLDYGFAELARRDKSRANCEVELTNPKDRELRIGATVNLGLDFSKVGDPFDINFSVYADGTKLGDFTKHVSGNGIVDVPVKLDKSFEEKETVTVEVQMRLDEDITMSIDVPVSDKAPTHFTDTAYHWAEEEIEYAAGEEWIEGYGKDLFKPDGNITRAEFVTIMCRVLGLKKDKSVTFKDTKGHWAKGTIGAMAKEGYVKGYGEEFKPNELISRQEAVTILYRVYEPEKGKKFKFSDSKQIASYAKDAVYSLRQLGVIDGYEDGTFRPLAPLTRAECVKMIVLMNAE